MYTLHSTDRKCKLIYSSRKQISADLKKRVGGITKRYGRLLGVMDMFTIVIAVTTSYM